MKRTLPPGTQKKFKDSWTVHQVLKTKRLHDLRTTFIKPMQADWLVALNVHLTGAEGKKCIENWLKV